MVFAIKNLPTCATCPLSKSATTWHHSPTRPHLAALGATLRHLVPLAHLRRKTSEDVFQNKCCQCWWLCGSTPSLSTNTFSMPPPRPLHTVMPSGGMVSALPSFASGSTYVTNVHALLRQRRVPFLVLLQDGPIPLLGVATLENVVFFVLSLF